jgi:hypothetical protein
MMNNILTGIVLFSSFAMRTPNQIDLPPDYEISLGAQNKHFYINQQWEREVGINYIDQEAYITWEPSIFYFKPYYIDKTSKKINYAQLDLRFKHKSLSIGTTIRNNKDTSPLSCLISAGLKRNAAFNKIKVDYAFDYYYSTKGADLKGYFKLFLPLSNRASLYSVLDYNRIGSIEFYKVKTGFEFAL